MTSQQHPLSVLVVDDDDDLRRITRRLLEVEGHRVEDSASLWFTGRLRDFRPDVILLDANMNGLRANDIVRALRRTRNLADTLVLLYSGLPADALDAMAHECGADGFVEKAGGPDALLARLRLMRSHLALARLFGTSPRINMRKAASFRAESVEPTAIL